MTADSTGVAVHDHLRPAGDDPPVARGDESPVGPGIYRVVGTGESSVTLLRVGDADGYRVNTGEVVTVDRDALAAFESAENPDGNRPLGERVRGALTTLGWNVRAFVAGLRARPLATTVGLALVLVGHQGHRVLSVPESWLTGVYFFGVLGVVYLGARGG